MIRTAAGLFRAQGYHATGLNQVLAEGGLPKGSLYFHFPGGKEQLAVESLQRAGDELRAGIAETLASTPEPAAALDRILALLGEHLVEPGRVVALGPEQARRRPDHAFPGV